MRQVRSFRTSVLAKRLDLGLNAGPRPKIVASETARATPIINKVAVVEAVLKMPHHEAPAEEVAAAVHEVAVAAEAVAAARVAGAASAAVVAEEVSVAVVLEKRANAIT